MLGKVSDLCTQGFSVTVLSKVSDLCTQGFSVTVC